MKNQAASEMALLMHAKRRAKGLAVKPPPLESRARGGVKSGETKRARAIALQGVQAVPHPEPAPVEQPAEPPPLPV